MATSSSPSGHLSFDQASLPWLDRILEEIVAYCRSVEPDPARQFALREQLLHWTHFGYVVLEGAIPHDLIDAFLADVDELFAEREKYHVLVSSGYHTYVPVKDYRDPDYRHHGLRIIDFHNSSVAAKKLSLHPSIVAFLTHLFRDRVVAMQSLTFLKGTQQAIHQDYAYVVADVPSHLCATWIALEDVHPDSGPLYYYAGSHSIPKFDWGDGLFRTKDSTRNDEQFAAHIHAASQRAGMPVRYFTPRKGDVLFWHGALGHGGAVARDPNRTRMSYVTHYSTAAGYRSDYRAKGEPPFVYEVNGALVYRHPLRPQDEDQFPRGAGL
jgi:ectoine hydroxylase-related dioxygenase (phytanoyl-CoA dioxygenase family)